MTTVIRERPQHALAGCTKCKTHSDHVMSGRRRESGWLCIMETATRMTPTGRTWQFWRPATGSEVPLASLLLPALVADVVEQLKHVVLQARAQRTSHPNTLLLSCS